MLISMAICKVCKSEYQKFRSTQKACSIDCALQINQAAKAKAKAKELRFRKEAARPLSYYAAKAQSAFNAFIRARDGKNCISCGNTKDVQYCAGHYFTRGARPWLRFNEDNVHVQCNHYCNLNLSGNISAYTPRLIDKIGQNRFDALKESTGDNLKPTREFYQEITVLYRKKLKELESKI